MRLLYLGNPNTIHVQRWLHHFVRAGHDVHLAAVNPVLVDADRLAGVTVHDLSLHRKPTKLAHLLEVFRVRSLIAELKPDLLHAHYVARYGWLAALTGFRPLVLTAWGSDVQPRPGMQGARIAKVLTPYALRRASVITVDAHDVGDICRRMTRRAVRIETVTFGADLTRFRPGLPVADLRRQLDIPLGAPIVVSPRIFAPLYNIDTIVESIPMVAKQFPDVIYVLQNYSSLGNPSYQQELSELVDKLGVTRHVRFQGEMAHSEMALLYNLGDVVVSVPASDGVPATFFEAMGCEVPLVVSDLPAYDPLIADGRTGLRVQPGSASEVARAINTLLASAETRRQIAQAAACVARAHGDFEHEMSKVGALYHELARH